MVVPHVTLSNISSACKTPYNFLRKYCCSLYLCGSLFWDQIHFGIIAIGCCQRQKIATYICVVVWQQDRVEVIVNDQVNRITPSFVAFTPS
jgi:hypothetical protein